MQWLAAVALAIAGETRSGHAVVYTPACCVATVSAQHRQIVHVEVRAEDGRALVLEVFSGFVLQAGQHAFEGGLHHFAGCHVLGQQPFTGVLTGDMLRFDVFCHEAGAQVE